MKKRISPKTRMELKSFHTDPEMTVSAAIAEMNRKGLRPATLEEVFGFGQPAPVRRRATPRRRK